MGKVKHKTHKASAKRFKLTATGKVTHFHTNDNSHMKVKKSTRTLRRQEGQSALGSKNEAKKIKRLLLS